MFWSMKAVFPYMLIFNLTSKPTGPEKILTFFFPLSFPHCSPQSVTPHECITRSFSTIYNNHWPYHDSPMASSSTSQIFLAKNIFIFISQTYKNIAGFCLQSIGIYIYLDFNYFSGKRGLFMPRI